MTTTKISLMKISLPTRLRSKSEAVQIDVWEIDGSTRVPSCSEVAYLGNIESEVDRVKQCGRHSILPCSTRLSYVSLKDCETPLPINSFL